MSEIKRLRSRHREDARVFGVTHTKVGLTITDATWLGLLQQALDGYAKTDGIPSDVAELVTRLQERLLEIAG